MDGGAIARLLRLKRQRAERAERALAQARGMLAEAVQRRDSAATALEDYRQWRVGHELQLFQSVQGQAVRPLALQYLRDDVAALRRSEQEKQVQLAQLVQQRDSAAQSLQAAAAARRRTAAARDAFADLAAAQRWQAEQALQAGEELELDDVIAALKRPR